MPLKRLILLISILLAMSPLMSQLAIASVSHASDHSSQHAGQSVEAFTVTSGCACCDQDTGQTCSDTGCQCDTCVSTIIHHFLIPQKTLPQPGNINMRKLSVIDTVFTVIVPPPIVIL